MKPTNHNSLPAEESAKPVSKDPDTTKTSLDRRKFVEIVTATGRMLKYDSASVKITNYPEANAWLSRTYRKGWDLDSI